MSNTSQGRSFSSSDLPTLIAVMKAFKINIDDNPLTPPPSKGDWSVSLLVSSFESAHPETKGATAAEIPQPRPFRALISTDAVHSTANRSTACWAKPSLNCYNGCHIKSGVADVINLMLFSWQGSEEIQIVMYYGRQNPSSAQLSCEWPISIKPCH